MILIVTEQESLQTNEEDAETKETTKRERLWGKGATEKELKYETKVPSEVLLLVCFWLWFKVHCS